MNKRKYRAHRDPKSLRIRDYSRAGDYGYLMSRELTERYARRMGIPFREAERQVDLLAEEMLELLRQGKPVGLPRCPTIQFRPKAGHGIVKGQNLRSKAKTVYEKKIVPHPYIHVPRWLRDELRDALVDTGTIADHARKVRARLFGKSMTAAQVERMYKERNRDERRKQKEARSAVRGSKRSRS